MTNSKDDRIDASSPAPELPVPVPDITRLPQPLTSFVDREIGSLLYIGTRTAEFHVANGIGQLGVANRRETAAVASQLGLV